MLSKSDFGCVPWMWMKEKEGKKFETTIEIPSAPWLNTEQISAEVREYTSVIVRSRSMTPNRSSTS